MGSPVLIASASIKFDFEDQLRRWRCDHHVKLVLCIKNFTDDPFHKEFHSPLMDLTGSVLKGKSVHGVYDGKYNLYYEEAL